MSLGRRAFLLGLGAAGCSRTERSAKPLPSVSSSAVPLGGAALIRTDTWVMGDYRAVIVMPARTERVPVVFALHGRGEAVKPPSEGVLGWPRDYALVRAMERVFSPPLTEADLEGFVDRKRLDGLNARLRSRPFGGLVVVCPWVPDLDPHGPEVRGYGEFLVGALLPKVQKELPVVVGATGIDGVSLGGAVALRVGLTHPEVFRAVGSLQPALRDSTTREFVELAVAARKKNPAMHLRLLTSHDDYFRKTIERQSAAWRAAGIAHDYADIPGPHDYAFNRGPGSIELLTWHDNVLREPISP